MPRAFDITPATPTIKLSPAGEGEFSFTVSNALKRPVRARALAQPEGQTQAEWLGIGGASERDFAADGTQQFTVRLKVPAGTPPGSYGLHLLVSTVTNPDEEYATGPAVSFEVAPSAPPKKPFPWWIVALAAGVLVLGGGGFLLFSKLRGRPPAAGTTCQADAACPANQRCVQVNEGLKSCLLRPGQKCSRDIDCSSFWCTPQQVCSRDDGQCKDSTECRPPAFTCDNGFCRKVLGQACDRDEACASGVCEGGLCKSGKCEPPCSGRLFCVRGACRPIFIRDRIFRFER